MKKRKNQHKLDYQKDCTPLQNPVAKFAHQFNKAHSFCDKSKYRRNSKHRKQEASPIVLTRAIGEAFCLGNRNKTEYIEGRLRLNKPSR